MGPADTRDGTQDIQIVVHAAEQKGKAAQLQGRAMVWPNSCSTIQSQKQSARQENEPSKPKAHLNSEYQDPFLMAKAGPDVARSCTRDPGFTTLSTTSVHDLTERSKYGTSKKAALKSESSPVRLQQTMTGSSILAPWPSAESYAQADIAASASVLKRRMPISSEHSLMDCDEISLNAGKLEFSAVNKCCAQELSYVHDFTDCKFTPWSP